MTTPELLEFIRIEHALGMSLSEIIQLLTHEGGWDRGDVAEAFSALGLPEEAIESFFVKDIMPQATIPPVSLVVEEKIKEKEISPDSPLIESHQKVANEPFVKQPSIEQRSIEPQKNIEYTKHAAPMHYVEEPEKIEKPTLARPASLTGQASRPLVRTMSTAVNYAKIDNSKQSQHAGAFVHVSKLGSADTSPQHSKLNYPAEQTPILNEASLEKESPEFNQSSSFLNEIPKEEPKPRSVVSPIYPASDKGVDSLGGIKIGQGGEIKEEGTSDQVKNEIDISSIKSIGNIPPLPPIQTQENITPPVQKLNQEIEENIIAPKPIQTSPVLDSIISAPNSIEPLPPPPPAILPKIEKREPVVSVKSLHEIKKIEPLIEKVFSPVFTLPQQKIESIPPSGEETMAVDNKVQAEKILANEELNSVQTKDTINSSISAPIFNLPSVKAEESHLENATNDKPKDENIVLETKNSEIIEAPVPEIKTEITKEAVSEKPVVLPEVLPPTPSVAPPVTFTPPAPQYVQAPPQYIQLPPQQIFVMPQQMYGQQMPQLMYPPQIVQGQTEGMMPGQPPLNTTSQFPHVEEIGSTAPDLEEQAYLAQFGQAKMPEGLIKPPQSMVAPTIIYAPQVVSQSTTPAGNFGSEVKKPDPIRFDIGRVRTARKTDQTSYTGRPSLIAAVSGMDPVESKTSEEFFKQPSTKSESDLSFASLEAKDAIHSIKVPHKRTMASDLISVQEGALASQVVSQSTKEGTTPGAAMSNTAAAIIDEEPLPPPPPKKSTKSIWIISLVLFVFIVISAAAAYYFIVLRLPSSDEVYKTALGVATRGPSINYDATLSINGKSTGAEPENIKVDFFASGTLGIRSKSFDDGIHELKFKIEHTGVLSPLNIDFDGVVKVVGDEVYISQNSPSHGTKIENLLKTGEWIETPYNNLGKIIGLTSAEIAASSDYGQIAPTVSLFKLMTTNSPIVVSGMITKSLKDGRELYTIPIKLEPKRVVLDGDALSKYFRGAEFVATTPARSQVLENRYKEISGEIIVDKLLMRPISLSLNGVFDPSKIPFDGNVKIKINFGFNSQSVVVNSEGDTYDEIVSKRATESVSSDIITRDAPYVAIAPVLELALKQYYEKIGRFPLVINDLVTSGFIGKEAIPETMASSIFYSAYVDKPKDLLSGIRCTTKNNKCNFYHLGINLQYRKSPSLQNDADVDTSVISGSDNTGCHNELGFSCLDMSFDKGNSAL